MKAILPIALLMGSCGWANDYPGQAPPGQIPVVLGGPVNTGSPERFAAPSLDGKYLCFTSATPSYSQDVYWVSAAAAPKLSEGTAPVKVTQHDAMMLSYHVPMLVERLKASGKIIPEGVAAQLAAAKEAEGKKDYYKAFRLCAQAAGLATGSVERAEVAASLQIRLNRAIFARGETITLTLTPLFSLGHPLTESYRVRTWLESPAGVLAGTEQQRSLTDLKPTTFDFPTERLADGVLAVGYQLDTGTEKLVEFRHAVLIAKDVQRRWDVLKAEYNAVKGSYHNAAARETLEYVLEGMEKDRTGFGGNWQREAHPYGMYLSYVNFAATGRPVPKFPAFTGRVRYPEDMDFAERLTSGSEALLRQTGDMQQAYRAADGRLARYRIFVPAGYSPARKYPLIVALHSGAGDRTYFEWETLQAENGAHPENVLKRLAQEKGYIVACPNGEDVEAVLDRVASVYSVDRGRVFLTGWSVGAAAAWRIAVRSPERFRAIAPVAGVAGWLDRTRTEKAAGLFVLASAGGKDPSVKETRRTSALAKELFPNFAYREYAEATHDGVWSEALPAVLDYFDQFRAEGIDYLGQKPPGDTPVVFAPGIVSNRNLHGWLRISPSGKDMCWTAVTEVSSQRVARVLCVSKGKDGKWSAPQSPPFAADGLTSNPQFSQDGSKLIFHARESLSGPWVTKYVEKTADGWGAPRSDGVLLKPGSSFTKTGKVYYTDVLKGKAWNRGIYRAEYSDGAYLAPQPLDASVNSPYIDYTPFVSPDESYLMWSSSRPSRTEEMFLYISFRRADGSWSAPVKMHEALKFPGYARFPSLSPDGKYLFFCGDDGELYWVRSSVIEGMRASR